jgi:predicted phage-related endonuclease
MTLIPIPADPAGWHALRARHVGASEVAALFGAQPDYAQGRFALWQIKAGRMPPPPVDNPRVRAGLALEDAIAQMAAEQQGWTLRPGVYASHESGLGATLDRIIEAPAAGDAGMTGPGVLEVKNVDWLVHKRAWGGEPPMHILLQLQAQLLATGYGWGVVAALVGGNDVRVYRYTARPALHIEMARRVADFWRAVRDGAAPNADASDSARRALVATTPDLEDEKLDLTGDDEAAALAVEWLRQAKAVKAAEKLRDAAKHALVQRIGAHSGALGDGWRVSLVDVAETPARVITAEMIGQTIPGRAASRRATIREEGGAA